MLITPLPPAHTNAIHSRCPLLLPSIAAFRCCPALLPSIAVLQGRYKLIWGYPGWNNPSWNGWIQAPTAFREGKEYDGDALLPSHPQAKPPRPRHECLAAACLYDIIADPTEHTDIAAKHAPVVATMKARILELLKTEVTVEKSGLCPTPCGSTADPRCTQIAKDTGFWQPWLSRASLGAQCPSAHAGANTTVTGDTIVDYAVKNPDLSTLAPPPPPPAPAPSLWFRGFNQIKESGQEGFVRCGEVDAASRMPDAIFDPILENEQALRAFEDITLALYGVYNDDGQTKDFGLELGRCADKNYTVRPERADNVKWAPDELMSGICAKQCNCNFCLRPAPWCKAPQLPSCVDEPDDPKAGKWCSLCGPKYNKPITVNLFACGNPDETTCPGPDAQTPVADWARVVKDLLASL